MSLAISSYVAGGGIQNTSTTITTKADILNMLRAVLTAAGMTNVNSAPAPTTVTISIGASATVTLGTGSAPAAGTRIIFQTTGALPTGLTAGTTYFVTNPSGAVHNVATTSGGASITTSGSQSGTQSASYELLFQSVATTGASLQMRFRCRDNNGSCVQISMENVGGSVVGANSTTTGISLLASAGKQYRMIATPYYFWVFSPGSYGASRDFGCGGVPWIPPFLYSPATTELGYLTGQCFQDSDGTHVPNNFRNNITTAWEYSNSNQQCDWNGNLIDVGQQYNQGTTSAANCLQPWGPSLANYCSPAAQGPIRRFSDGSYTSFDPWIAWSTAFGDNDPRIRGMLWDAVLIMDGSPAGDTTATFDGYTWTCISNLMTPSLWVISA